MTNQYLGGVAAKTGVEGDTDAEFESVIRGTFGKVSAKMEEFKVADAFDCPLFCASSIFAITGLSSSNFILSNSVEGVAVIIVVTNLPPREMKGILSEGMIVCAESPDGNLSIVSPEKDVPDGSLLS